MSARDADLTLRQIVEVCDKAVELRNSMTLEDFRGDWRKQMLSERLVEVLGEAVKRLPDDLCQRHQTKPARKIREYFIICDSARAHIAPGRRISWLIEANNSRLKKTIIILDKAVCLCL
jgi:methylase of polypeptide subunit release factors